MAKLRDTLIREWQVGDSVEGYALLTRKEKREDRNGRVYLDLELADVSGSIAGKVWSDCPAVSGEFAAHRFVWFRGQVKSYRDQLQLTIDDCRETTEADRFDPSRLVPSTREDINDLWARLERLMSGLERPLLRRLAAETLEVFGAALREHPAAKSMHHAFRGGLLEHVVSMAELASLVAGHYRELDRDLLLLGVLFHDLGKIRELGAMPANDYTLEGRLIGHVVIGRDLVRERCAAIPGFPTDVQLLLEHLVLSHQGKKEFSSPVEPMTPEALALHFIDDLDSKLAQLRAARDTSPGMTFLRGLGRYVYLPQDGAPALEAAEVEPAAGAGVEAGEPDPQPSLFTPR